MRVPFSRRTMDTRMPCRLPCRLRTRKCRQSKTLFMGWRQELSPKLMGRTWMKARFPLYRQ